MTNASVPAERLLACPFCGVTPTLGVLNRDDGFSPKDGGDVVHHGDDECPADGFHSLEVWNRRAEARKEAKPQAVFNPSGLPVFPTAEDEIAPASAGTEDRHAANLSNETYGALVRDAMLWRHQAASTDGPGLREIAYDVAAHIWTDVLKMRGDYEGWSDDKGAAAKLILAALAARPVDAAPSLLAPREEEPEGNLGPMSLMLCGAWSAAIDVEPHRGRHGRNARMVMVNLSGRDY